jgi:RND family efflux transporter MFP subunit
MTVQFSGAAKAGAEAVATGSSTLTLNQARDARGFLGQWLVLLIARAPGVQSALVLSLDDSGALVPAAMWPETLVDVSELASPAQRCVDQRSDLAVALPDGPRGSGRHALAVPVFSADRLVAAVVMTTQRQVTADLQRLLADIQWGAGWIDALFRQRELLRHDDGLARARQALDMLALLGAHDRVDDACAAMATELARVSGCDRVAVGLAQRRSVRLTSLSHAAWFERRSAAASALEAAMTEAVEQRASLAWPAAPGADRSLVVNAQRTLAGDQAALTVPIVSGARAVGAVCWQLPPDRLTPEFAAQAEALAVVLAPLLARLDDQSHWWAGRAPALLRRAWRALSDRRRPGFAVGALLGLAVLGAISLVDTTYRVPARAALEGQVQRVIAAPFEGFVVEAPLRAGQTVVRGALLARLDDRDLRLERARLSAELAQQQHKRDEAMARHERGEQGVLLAQLAETEARLDQVEERLARTLITAPFDGVLVSGDLSQAIGGPVEQGKTLFELAPLTGYRVVLKVDERDVRELRPGQAGTLVLAGMADERLAFTVRHVSVANAEDGQNLFRVEADLARQDQRLRPGMEGVGKIEASQHPLLWIWTHRLVDWLRLNVWRYGP